MADEVIIYEMEYASEEYGIMMPPHKIQVLNIGVTSTQLDDKTEVIRLKCREAAYWWKFGGSGVSAAPEADDNGFLVATERHQRQLGSQIQ